MKDFTWLNELETDEIKAFGRVVSIFLRGMTPEDLADLTVEHEPTPATTPCTTNDAQQQGVVQLIRTL